MQRMTCFFKSSYTCDPNSKNCVWVNFTKSLIIPKNCIWCAFLLVLPNEQIHHASYLHRWTARLFNTTGDTALGICLNMKVKIVIILCSVFER